MSQFDPQMSIAKTSEEYRVELSTSAVVAGLLGVYVVALCLRTLSGVLPAVVVAPVVVVAVSFVPGGLALLWGSGTVQFNARDVVYALGISLMILMGVGFVLNLVLPIAGVTTPLSGIPLALGLSVVVAALAGLAVVDDEGQKTELSTPSVFAPVPLALLLLPLLTVLSVVFWNVSGNNLPLLTVLTITALVPLVLALFVNERWHALGTWCMALAVLYHSSLWKYNGFSGNPAGVWTWSERMWTPGVSQVQETSSELLQNGVLFPAYAHLSDIHVLTQYDVVNPFFVSFLPLALYVAFRRYTNSDIAVLGAALFIVAHPFYVQYPQAGRAATPVLFLALLGVVISDASLRKQPVSSSVLALLFATGIAVSHYGTAYFVMFALIGAFLLVMILAVVDQYVGSVGGELSSDVRVDGGNPLARMYPEDLDLSRTILSKAFVTWYASVAIAWYLFLAGGQRFKVLPNHMYRSLDQLLSGEYFTGRTAARVQRDYGSSVIDLSRRVYFVVAVLTAIGIAYVYYDRFLGDGRAVVDDVYLAIATMLLGLFGATFIVRNWGGGRPMMIAFSFVAVFAVIGILVLTGVLSGVVRRDDATGVRMHLIDTNSTGRSGVAIFALLIAVLFVLNSGVAGAIGAGGQAPSNAPLQEESHYFTDIATHTWMVDNHDGPSVYGDLTANGQTDWYRPQIVTNTEPTADYGAWKPRGRLAESVERGTVLSDDPGYGYVLLLGHNLEEETTGYREESISPEELEPDAEDHHKVYTTGESEIYLWPAQGR